MKTGFKDENGIEINESDVVLLRGDSKNGFFKEAYIVRYDHYYDAWGLTGVNPGVGSYHRLNRCAPCTKVVGKYPEYTGELTK